MIIYIIKYIIYENIYISISINFKLTLIQNDIIKLELKYIIYKLNKFVILDLD